MLLLPTPRALLSEKRVEKDGKGAEDELLDGTRWHHFQLGLIIWLSWARHPSITGSY
jgi:hypothetical protein